MRARCTLAAVAALAAAVTLAGCGADSAPDTKPVADATSAAAVATPSQTTSEPPAAASTVAFPALDGVTSGVPQGWKASEHDGLTFALPPMVAGERSDKLDEDEWGLSGLVWYSGEGVPSSVVKTKDGGESQVPYDFRVGVSDEVKWDGEIRDSSDRQFSLAVPGATLAGGTFTDEDWASIGGGKGLTWSVFLQGDNGRYYNLNGTVGVGEEDIVRQLAGSLKIGD